eukprot:IDg1499t1
MSASATADNDAPRPNDRPWYNVETPTKGNAAQQPLDFGTPCPNDFASAASFPEGLGYVSNGERYPNDIHTTAGVSRLVRGISCRTSPAAQNAHRRALSITRSGFPRGCASILSHRAAMTRRRISVAAALQTYTALCAATTDASSLWRCYAAIGWTPRLARCRATSDRSSV